MSTLRGVWWKAGNLLFISIKIPPTYKNSEFTIRGNNNLSYSFTLPKSKTGDSVVASLNILEETLPHDLHYLTIECDKTSKVLLAKLNELSFDLKLKLGFKEGDLAGSIQNIYVSAAKTVLNQIDGMLANL